MSHAASELLECLEAAPHDPRQWPEVLRLTAQAMGAPGASLVYDGGVEGTVESLLSGIDEVARSLYLGHFGAQDIIQTACRKREVIDPLTRRIYLVDELLPREILVRSEFFNDFLRPFQMDSLMLLALHAADGRRAGINLSRPPGRSAFDQGDLALAFAVHPRLCRAFDLALKLAPMRAPSADFDSVVERLGHGLLLITGEGRVRYANRMARDLLADGSAITACGGRLAARDAGQNRRLQALIGAAAGDLRGGGWLAVGRGPYRPPLSISVGPHRTGPLAAVSGPRCALVCITDIEQSTTLSEHRLRELFALTRTEAKVAVALFEAGGIKEAAEEMGLSALTVRNHLGRIFDKTRVNRQADLMRLMTRLSESRLTYDGGALPGGAGAGSPSRSASKNKDLERHSESIGAAH
jgi:DNA-binding CsgD family transcriptional regulator/PAS domain-containing protein